jgi:hypothetical protein
MEPIKFVAGLRERVNLNASEFRKREGKHFACI